MSTSTCTYQCSISGAILGSLLEVICRSTTSDQEGILFGSATTQIIKTVHDSNQILESEREKTIIGIQGFRVTGMSCSFYDSQGNLSLPLLQKYMESSPDQYPIGWFRFRRNTPLRPSIRELSVHSRLEEVIRKYKKQKGIKDHPFVLGLFTYSNTKTRSIHSYDYRLMTTTQRSVTSVDLDITNLVHSSQEEYTTFTPMTPLSSSLSGFSMLNQLMNKAPSVVNDMEKFFDTTIQELRGAAELAYTSGLEVNKLEEEIRSLKMLENSIK